jgi:hypothetical protein
MTPPAQRSAREWFEAAARYYVEGHQACAWCGGQYRVFKAVRGHRLEYYCKDCDFYVSHDPKTDSYALEPGHDNASGPAPEVSELGFSSHGCLGLG